jgi:hypothetical protein
MVNHPPASRRPTLRSVLARCARCARSHDLRWMSVFWRDVTDLNVPEAPNRDLSVLVSSRPEVRFPDCVEYEFDR